jgi:L-lactate dehydrogenase complex protein LldF
MRIPLPKMMRHWREREFEKRLTPGAQRAGLGLWSWFARRPRLYRLATRAAARALRAMGGRKGRLGSLPLAGGWTATRDFPAPQGRSFMDQWKATPR